MANAKQTSHDTVGRFDYVEPMNMELNQADNAMINNPEDFCISVNLEVSLPSRFYEDTPTILNASSDNGTISFFGGVNTSDDGKDNGQGFLSTSWTDVSVHNTDKGNRDSIGIESINISYSPTFFPVVTIKFVDVRGASLFMPQEKAYENYTKSGDFASGKMFQSSSFFKSLFSMPSPIFKLTVKGFYGQSVSYNLMMSKSNFEFDSENGNFIANVEFAGQMYGIYTDLPMSFVALAPYIDNKRYWNEKVSNGTFVFDNQTGMITIPELIKAISSATTQSKMESMQSPTGRELNKIESEIELLNKIKEEFPIHEFNSNNLKKTHKLETRGKAGKGIGCLISTDENHNLKVDEKSIKEKKQKLSKYSTEKNTYYIIRSTPYIDLSKNKVNSNSVFVSNDIVGDSSQFFAIFDAEEYKKSLDELVSYGEEFKKYKEDFNYLLDELDYGDKYFERGKATKACLPAFAFIQYDGKSQIIRGIDSVDFGYTLNLRTPEIVVLAQQKVNGEVFKNVHSGETHMVFYNDFYLYDEGIKKLKSCDKKFFDEINGGEINLTQGMNNTCVVWRMSTNIFDYIEEDLKRLVKKKEELKKEIVEVQQEKAKALLGFDLNIQNIYNLIFAHIDTFMHKYYDVLKETSINDRRNKLLCSYKQNICDVPSKILAQGKVPPYPAIVEERGESLKDTKKVLVWPTKILQEEIAETDFVNKIIAASLQLSDDLEKAREVMTEYANSPVKSMEYGVDKLIPSNIVDFLSDEVKINPYEECVDSFKKEGGNINKIWFVFAMRCLYFLLMFRRYRTAETSKKNISNVCDIFAINEVTNIRKAFGDNMTRQLLTDIVSKKNDAFFKFLKEEISSTIEDKSYSFSLSTDDFYKTSNNFAQNVNLTNILNGYFYKIEIDSEKYSVIPVKSINKEKLENDIRNNNCLNNGDYIIIKNNGDIIEDRLLNEKTIKVYENTSMLFQNYISLIQGDETYKEISSGFNDIQEDFEDMLKNYLGSSIVKNNKTQKEGSSLLSPYNIVENKKENTKIFSTNNEDNEYQSYEYQDVKSVYENVWLETMFNNKKVKYTSFIANRKCIDTVNVLINGLPGNDTKKQQEHFASTFSESQNVDKIRFIGNNATDYDIAYIFLFTLPIDFRYSHIATFSNVKNIAKTVLLREGAFYYWQEHWKEMQTRLKANAFNTDKMNENSIPIVKNKETYNSNAPTFYPTSNKEDEYLTWDFIVERDKLKEGHALVSVSRRKFLKEYFEKWVETEFSNGIKNSDGPTNAISKLYVDEVLYIDYSEVLNRDINLYIPGNGQYASATDIPKTFFDKTYNTFIECMKKAYPENYINTTPVSVLEDTTTLVTSNEDIKLSIYLTLQTLYNKFIAGNPLSRWTFKDKDSDFKRFLYLDSYYKEIGDRLILNGTNISHLLSDISTTVNALTHSEEGVYRESVYEFLSRICEKNGLNLIALPINPFIFTTKESSDYSESILWDLFDTIPYSKMNTGDTSCFISLYTYRPSEHLDMQDDSGLYGYENDGFDINKNGEKDLPLPLQSFGDSSSIPAFAVSYAKQNQSIFKRINVGTTNPQTTEASLAMTFNIASKGDSAPRDTVLQGQDIFSVYSNYSYTCDVEMMGCAPISPMMYFQLNNIPMFKGAYMIYSVEHSITAGNMTTKFKGNRVSKNAIPFAQPDVIYLDENGKPHDYDNGGSSNNDSVNNQKNTGSSDYTPSLDENNKMRMAQAFDWCFECSTPTKGMCSRYTFRMAYGYKKGKKECPFAGGNANEEGYWKNLENIGYKKQVTRNFETSKELVSFLNDSNFDYGDVIVYYANKFKLDKYNSNDKTEYVYPTNTSNLRIADSDNRYGIPSSVAYGHTQIYTGDAKISETGSKWATSVKNNYGAGNFIYGTQTKNYNIRDWNLIIFRAN